jgi:hypothetical protein
LGVVADLAFCDRVRGAAAAIALGALVACGGGRGTAPRAVTPDEAPPAEVAWRDGAPVRDDFPPRPPFVAPGEAMSYRVVLHGLEVAAFQVAAGAVGDVGGRRAIVVQSGVQSSRVMSLFAELSGTFTSWIDVETGRPLLFRSEEQVTKGDPIVERVEVPFHQRSDGGLPVRVKRGDAAEVTDSQVVAGAIHDLNSYLVLVRGWDPAVGTRVSVDVMRSRYVWRTQVTAAAYETVVTELGDMPCLRLDGISRRLRRDGTIDPRIESRRYSMWISDDADRVPVLLVAHTDYGDVRMELIDYRAGGARLGTVVSSVQLGGTP